MRERLIIALVSMTLAVIALFGIPRAYYTADLVRDKETADVERAASLIAVAVAERERSSKEVTPGFLEMLVEEGEHVSVTLPGGTRVEAGADVADDDDVAATRPVAAGGAVTLTRSGEVVGEQISAALLPLVLLGLGLAVLAAAVGFLLAQRLARPFRRLAHSAEVLGSGRFDVDIPHSRVPEAEAMGSALRGAAEQLDTLVRRDRKLSVVASHELRTPVTALRLSLEDLTLWPQTPPDVAAELQHALGELDRLSTAITTLLEDNRGMHLGTPIDVDLTALVDTTMDRFREPAANARRELVLDAAGTVPAHVVPGPVAQILEALLDNALAHGTGRITVAVAELGTHLRVSVADEGRRTAAPGVIHEVRGVGGGLSAISLIAESLGGQLTVEDTPTTVYALRLPRSQRRDESDRLG